MDIDPFKFDKYTKWHTGTDPADRMKLSLDEEQTLQLFFQLTTQEELDAANQVKESGGFSKLAMLYSITEFYDKHKWVSKKQYEVLRKNILSKTERLQEKLDQQENEI